MMNVSVRLYQRYCMLECAHACVELNTVFSACLQGKV